MYNSTVYKPVRSTASIKCKLWAPVLTIYALLMQLTVQAYTPWIDYPVKNHAKMQTLCKTHLAFFIHSLHSSQLQGCTANRVTARQIFQRCLNSSSVHRKQEWYSQYPVPSRDTLPKDLQDRIAQISKKVFLVSLYLVDLEINNPSSFTREISVSKTRGWNNHNRNRISAEIPTGSSQLGVWIRVSPSWTAKEYFSL